MARRPKRRRFSKNVCVASTMPPFGIQSITEGDSKVRLSRRKSLTVLAGSAALPWIPTATAATQPIRLVVLDVGGTIIEDRGDLPETLRSAMAKHGVTVTIAQINQWRGASKRSIVKRFVKDDKLAEQIYREFSSNIIEMYRTVPPIAGVEDAIQNLRAGGYLVATNTGFDRDMATPIFRRLGWEKYFVASICSDDVADGRPA